MAFNIGDKVSLKAPLPYLKTSDPMPMLRPSELVSQDEVGEIVEIRSKADVVVRFRRGSFLVSSDRLELNKLESTE